jgi:hypothetical protein
MVAPIWAAIPISWIYLFFGLGIGAKIGVLFLHSHKLPINWDKLSSRREKHTPLS